MEKIVREKEERWCIYDSVEEAEKHVLRMSLKGWKAGKPYKNSMGCFTVKYSR